MPLLIASIGLGAFQVGKGIYNQIQGGKEKRQAIEDKAQAREDIAGTHYADYTQNYYNELQRQSQLGLPEAQRQYMEQQADRAASIGLGASDDRRGGLAGIGYSQANLANQYRQIGMADVAARQQNMQQQMAEMQRRGQATYGETMDLYKYDLAEAEKARQEAISKQQAAQQDIYSGLGTAAVGVAGGLGGGFGKTFDLASLYGTGSGNITNTANTAMVLGEVVGAGSDIRLKKNIKRIGKLSDNINLYTWEWNDIAKSLNLDTYKPVGVIAQEIKEIKPEIVSVGADGYYMVDYSKLN